MKSFAIAATLLSSIIFTVPAPAHAQITTEHLDTDAEMLEYLSDTMFVAEGRIGDLAGAATFELDLGGDTGAPAETAQYGWVSGSAETFYLTYDAGTGVVAFSLGGVDLSYTTPYFDFDQIFVRTRAVDEGTSVQVGSLVIDGSPVGDLSSAAGADGLDILWIKGASLNDGFAMSGVAVLSWTGDPPSHSRLAFQVKIGKLGLVGIESGTWGGIKMLAR